MSGSVVRRFQGVSSLKNSIPDSILSDPGLLLAVSSLPSNYNFEVFKSVWRLREKQCTCVALQFPEGLIMYSSILADIFRRFNNVEVVILGDVTYGACCVDDLTAKALGADFLIHYGHSCLVPIDVSTIPVLYVFVEIGIDNFHLEATIKKCFPINRYPCICLAGTVQFLSALHAVKEKLMEEGYKIIIPQAKPLSGGEVLGCTSPVIDVAALSEKIQGGEFVVVFVADGRFHLESLMISNPKIPMYLYSPYSKTLTEEKYDHDQMKQLRRDAIEKARSCSHFGLILGTLGRQGSLQILEHIEEKLIANNKSYTLVCLSEISPAKLDLMAEVDAWIQVACPRLSIDWGYAFDKPLLSSYELEVVLNDSLWKAVYPMDYYSNTGGSWTNYAHKSKAAAGSKR